ncbi:YqgE/AlgH family protein [Streptomyces sp. WMMB 322]|uniref:YqgE/AlgH family protein n=1 Tax=Streptomyces sp. WMMB 322 TaxID=1286821 RepID=UPI0006E46CAA|nr:YqgE/AlgH family protein [Streptomyces sp. WMMB 322]SCK20932.1 putative transcriptional regulator [Streptomyces sp. WMMB 322]
MTEVSSLTGRLLVATPVLADPNFDRAVVLLLDHDAEGSLGVVLNRPTPVDVVDILEPWAALAGEPGVVFQGGPVSLDAALGVAVVPASQGRGHAAGERPGAAARDGDGSPGEADGEGGDGPLGWRRVHGAIGLVDLEAPPELLAAELGSLRIFAGYAGWGPGQLEKELSEGAWYVVESEPGDVSSPSPERLWRSVLRRQRSELAMVATYPDDASLN